MLRRPSLARFGALVLPFIGATALTTACSSSSYSAGTEDSGSDATQSDGGVDAAQDSGTNHDATTDSAAQDAASDTTTAPDAAENSATTDAARDTSTADVIADTATARTPPGPPRRPSRRGPRVCSSAAHLRPEADARVKRIRAPRPSMESSATRSRAR
jgi:hypothetical protein